MITLGLKSRQLRVSLNWLSKLMKLSDRVYSMAPNFHDRSSRTGPLDYGKYNNQHLYSSKELRNINEHNMEPFTGCKDIWSDLPHRLVQL